jgi:hypothetical protein
MRVAVARIIGTILMVTAFFGLLFSSLAIVQTWRVKPGLESRLDSLLNLLDATINTTTEGLAIVESSLETASGNVNSLEEATQTLAQSISDSAPMVDSLIGLVGEELPETITATQISLESAQTSALLIDNMLATISQIPFLGLGRYQPEVPLNDALGQVSASLAGLPASLATIETSLETASANLVVIEQQVSAIGQDIRQINENLASARAVIDDYQATIGSLQTQVHLAQAGLPLWLNRLAWLLTFVLAWLGIMQVGLFSQGLALASLNQLSQHGM